MNFEGEYLCSFIFDTACRFVDVGDAVLAERVAEKVAIFIVAVEPEVGGRKVFVVDEFTFDLEVGEMIVFASFLS